MKTNQDYIRNNNELSFSTAKNIPVLIVGSGPVGLSLALALARQNIHSLILEKHPGTTVHPRARGVNARSMELFRQWGNDIELMHYEHPKEARRFIWAESFQGDEITRVALDASGTTRYSPADVGFVSQDRVEESLYNALLKYKTTGVQFLKKLVSFEENSTGVIAQVLNRETNQIEFLSAQYLIAADGAHSQIRRQLGITMEGPDNLGQYCSVYCEIDISAWTKHRPCIGYFFTENPKLSNFYLASVDGANRWLVIIKFLAGMTKETFTNEYCINGIRQLVDLSYLEVNIIN